MIRRARLISGLIMFSYVVTHFTNHTLGLVSLEAMEAMLAVVYPFWANPLVTAALYGAFTVHFGLALHALWQRRTLRMPPIQILQYALGFSIPLMVLSHVVGNRVADTFFGAEAGYYTKVVTNLWYSDWRVGVGQGVLLLVVWVHACIGLRYRLRLEPWYERWQPVLYAGVLLLPTLALLGYLEASRETFARIAHEPGFLERAMSGRPSPESRAVLSAIWSWAFWSFAGAVAAVLAGRLARRWLQARRGLIRVTYPDGQSIAVVPGTSILEASRLLRRPHAAVCGGKGRCSTCRVRVRAGPRALPEPSTAEAAVLRRIGAAPNVRLACQLRPRGDVEAVPLLPAAVHPREGFRRSGPLLGSEKEIAILFADLRAFTQFAETKLPYDVVFILNRYFASMGHAIEEAGGRVDKFIGDGIMALFGIEGTAEEACRRALEAARLMSLRLDELNRAVAHDIDEPFRIGIGIHVGPVIVGEMGYGAATQLTAVGDAVNTASRLEALSKEYAAELVVSDEVAAKAGADLSAWEPHEVEIRGRRQPLVVRSVKRASELGRGAPAAGAATLAAPGIA